ncbi:hypothetical protein ACFXKJ_29560 [Kitasatospora indigofera]|uniref:hypothetical protein n=1 Tax=Kitasatospora indigofera TaxID=67307 RepID=UPI0036A849DE
MDAGAEDRERWELDPLVGVGPLRFGMTPEQVQEVLGEDTAEGVYGAGGRLSWRRYSRLGVSTIHGPQEDLVAVGVDANRGPLVVLEDVALVARVPSEARADIGRLAFQRGVKVVLNPEGEPDVPAWGISIGVAQQWGPDSGGFLQRRDTMLTDLLVAGPRLADDPYSDRTVAGWRHNSRRPTPSPGPWTVRPERDRPRWECVPLEGVGPLRFGMTPEQVSAALGGEEPASRRTYRPFPAGTFWATQGDPEEERLTEERFEGIGVRAHYWGWEEGNGPLLAAVTVLGRTGPQVHFDGIPLIGRPVTAVEADITRHVADNDLGLRFACRGDLGVYGLGVWVRSARVGDTSVSEARIGAEQWEEE